MSNEKTNVRKNEKITIEEKVENKFFYKVGKDGLEKKNDFSYSLDHREYGVKKLQSYIQEIEVLKNSPHTHIKEIYLKNGEEIQLEKLLNGSGITAMLGLLTLEVKTAKIEKSYALSTGGIIEDLDVVYTIELY